MIVVWVKCPGHEHAHQRPIDLPQRVQPTERIRIIVDAQVDQRERTRARQRAAPPSATRRPHHRRARPHAGRPAAGRPASGGPDSNASTIAGATRSLLSTFPSTRQFSPASSAPIGHSSSPEWAAERPPASSTPELAPATVRSRVGHNDDRPRCRQTCLQLVEQRRSEPRIGPVLGGDHRQPRLRKQHARADGNVGGGNGAPELTALRAAPEDRERHRSPRW